MNDQQTREAPGNASKYKKLYLSFAGKQSVLKKPKIQMSN